MNVLAMEPGLARVRALYSALLDDRAFIDTAPPADSWLSAEAAALLIVEARLLDRHRFDAWLALWEPDATLWVPLHEGNDPARDQSLLLDDHRRLRERVWRMHDSSAWALQPMGQVVRIVGSVEAWNVGPNELIATSTIALTHERLQKTLRLAARQIHRLRRTGTGLRLVRKTLLCPEITAGAPHLGWLM